MVVAGRVGEGLGQTPELDQPLAHLRVGEAGRLALESQLVAARVGHDVGVDVGHGRGQHVGADVVHQAGDEGLFRVGAPIRVRGQRLGDHRVGHRVLPESLHVQTLGQLAESLDRTEAERQIPHAREAEHDDGPADRRDLLRHTVERRVDQLEHLAGQRLVRRQHLGHVVGGRVLVAHDRQQLLGHLRHGRQVAHDGHDASLQDLFAHLPLLVPKRRAGPQYRR